ncbi:hypothetical protein [Prosthecobacter sp.]|uniref:hypothetical protein n=1 Tax=Prosthecobacter sp. TaxID=1965333 RepID=UPI003783157D
MSARKFSIKRVIFVLAGVLLILGLLYFLCGDTIANDLRLSKITRQLDTLPQPPGTILISTKAAVGLLVGNGNHCDFFAGAVYRSQSSAEAIQQHYEGRQFQNPLSGKNEEWDITILKDKNSFASLWLPDDFDHPEAWGLASESYSAGTLFIVRAMRSYDANGDFRCH